MASLGSAVSGATTGASIGTAFGGPGLGTAIGAGIGGIVGLFGGGDNSDEIEAAYRRAEEIIKAVGAPPETARAIYLQVFQQAGQLTPEVESKINEEFEGPVRLSEKPENRLKIQQTLGALEQMSRTGLGPEDISAFNQLRRQSAADAQAKQQQILQGAQQRGQLGAGDVLASQLMSAQGGAQEASAAADRIAAEASLSRRAALNQLLGGQQQMRTTDLDVDKYNTENERLRQQMLLQNATGRQERNVGRAQEANLANIQRQQRVFDENVRAANEEQKRQREAEIADYQNKLKYAALQSGLETSKAGRLSGQQDASNQNFSNIMSGIGQLGTSLGGAATKAGWFDRDPEPSSNAFVPGGPAQKATK